MNAQDICRSTIRSRVLPSLLVALMLLLALSGARPANAASAAVNPNAASPGTGLSILGFDLAPSTKHQAHLVTRNASQLLGSASSDGSGNLKFSATLPPIAEGSYDLVLSTTGGVVASTPFNVEAGLSLSILSNQVRAGRSLRFQVSDVNDFGRLTLSYLGRTVYGPTWISAGQAHQGQFVVPADIPDSFPANVPLQARVSSPRGLSLGTSVTLAVQAPLSGRYLDLQNVVSSHSAAASNERFSLSGRIEVDGEAPSTDLNFSAWWFGDNGQVVPLAGPPMQLSASGDFQLESAVPSLGSLGAIDAVGPGSVRFVGLRSNDFGIAGAGPQFEIVEGPRTIFSRDDDGQVDINVWVYGEDGPLQGALVRLVGETPLSDPVNQPSSLFNSLSLGISQVNLDPETLTLPPAGCPPSLSNQFTAADGRAEFVIRQVSSNDSIVHAVNGGDTWSAGLTPAGCTSVPGNPGQTEQLCYTNDTLINEFQIQIWTLHLGYGRIDQSEGGEIPEIWHVRHHKVTDTFTLTNPRTGQELQQNTSANLRLFPPKSPDGNAVLIGDPTVTGLRTRPNTGIDVGGQPIVNFIKLPDYSEPPLGSVLNFSPSQPVPRRMEFRHARDADGALTSAELFLPSGTNFNNLVSWGSFTRVIGAGGGGDDQCPGSASVQGDLYRMEFSEPLRNAMRYPGSTWPGKDRVCGSIRVRAGLLRDGWRQVCFNWAPLPAALDQPGTYNVLEIAESNRQAIITAGSSPGGEQSSSMPAPPPEYNVGRRDNRAARNYGVFHVIDDGLIVSNLSKLRGSHEQFSRQPNANQEREAEAATGGTFGSANWNVLVDQTVRLFQWTWGIPSLFGASVYAELRVLADQLFRGNWDAAGRIAELEAAARMQIMLVIGVDISVLFGLLVDAGASITGSIGSEMRVEMQDGNVVPTRTGLYFIWGIFFDGWVEIGCTFFLDPTCAIPDIEESFTIAEGQQRLDGPSTAIKASSWIPDPLPSARDLRGPLTALERRALFRHPAVAFDRAGHGMGLLLDQDDRLVAVDLSDRVPGQPHTLSSGLGIRSTAIAFVRNGEAVAAWVESTLSPADFISADLEQRATAQRVHYAVWDGQQWGPKAVLWNTPGGDTSLTLASCIENLLCRNRGEATLAFSHRHGGSLATPDQRIWYATFANGSFAAPRLVSSSPTPRLEVSPSVTYSGVIPTRVIGFVRYGVQDLEQVDSREFVYRHFGSSELQTLGTLQGDFATPVLDGNGSTLRIAFTRPDRNTGFAGTRHALHYTQGTCNVAGTCALAEPSPVLDAHGRAIYGMAPRLMKGPGGSPLVIMRSFGFGPDSSGQQVLPGDSIGGATLSGDLVSIAIDPILGQAAVRPLSNDGQVHFQSAAAFDPVRGESIALSSVLSSSALAANAEALSKRLGPAADTSRAMATLSNGGVALHAAAISPDPAVIALRSEATQLNPGGGLTVTATVANLGAELSAEQAALGRIQFRFDTPTGTDTPLVSLALPALKPGEVREVPIVLLVPQHYSVDEGRDLYALLVLDEALEQADGENDSALLRIGDLPVPFALESARTPGEPFVWIGWDDADDARVLGYRVYVEDTPGEITPLGSTPVKGFLDLSASYGQQRTYYVSSYSASGTESPLSNAVVAEAPSAPMFEPIFRSRFEAVVR